MDDMTGLEGGAIQSNHTRQNADAKAGLRRAYHIVKG